MESEAPAEIRNLIASLFEDFNNRNFAQFASAFGGDIVIEDSSGRWTGPEAPYHWCRKQLAFIEAIDGSEPTRACHKIVYTQVDDSHAHAVVSATFSFWHHLQFRCRRSGARFTF